jgi:hypothetical protein
MLVSFSDSQMQSIFAGATAQVPYAGPSTPRRGGGLLKTWCRCWPFDPLLLRCFPSVSRMVSGETRKLEEARFCCIS